VLFGLALVAVGIWLLTNVFESVAVLAWLVGISLVVAGIAEAAALGGERRRPVAWLAGGLLVVSGIAVMAWPDISLWAVAVVAGTGLMLTGVLRLLALLVDRDRSDWPAQLAVSGVSIALGAIVVAWPDATLVVLAIMLGIRAVASGLVAIGVGWQLHRLAA
jgi:uncharacterized membrane protein HdeD (DUF308 family)